MDKTVNELKKLKTIFCGTVKDLNKGLKLFTDIPSVNNDALFSPVINAEMIRLSSLIGYLNGMRDYIVALNPEMEQYNNGYIPKEYAEQNEEEKVKICLDIFQNAIHKACMIGAGIVNAELMDYKLAMIKKDEPKFMDFPAGEVHYGRLFKFIYLGELERVKMLSEKHREMSVKQMNESINKNKKANDVVIYVDALIAIKKDTDGAFISSEINKNLISLISEKKDITRIAMTIYSKEDHKVQIESVIKNGVGDPFMDKRLQTRFIDIKDLDESKKSDHYFIVSNNAMIEKSMRKAYGIE